MDSNLWWLVARAGGLTAYWLVAAAVVWGLLLSTRLLGGRPAPAWLLDVHRMLGALSVVFTAVHVGALLADRWLEFGWVEILVPTASHYRPAAVAWGVVGLYLLVAVELSSLLKRHLPDRLWRAVHLTTFAVFALATLHTFTAGSDAGNRALQLSSAAVVGLAAFLTVYRIVAGRRRARTAAPTATKPAIPAQRTTSRPAFHRLGVADVRRETGDTVSVEFDVPVDLADTFRFRPGQYLTLRTVVDGTEVRRAYSICSAVGEPLRVAVKEVPGGRLSPWVNSQLRPGDTVEVMPPAGRFSPLLDPSRRTHRLGVAAGSGITPVMSILKTALAVEPSSHFTLLYGNRHRDSVIFRTELDGLRERYADRLRVLHLYSRDPEHVPALSGRITGSKVRELSQTVLDPSAIDEAFICGPQTMTAEAKEALVDLGLDPERVHAETFGGAAGAQPAASTATLAPNADGAATVTVVQDGSEQDVETRPGEPILDAALRAGVDMPYSCQAGSCSTCRAFLCEGDVEMSANFALDAAEVDAGYVLTCQAVPQSGRVVVDLDRA